MRPRQLRGWNKRVAHIVYCPVNLSCLRHKWITLFPSKNYNADGQKMPPHFVGGRAAGKRGEALLTTFSATARCGVIRKQDAQKVAESKQIGVYIAIKYEK